MLAVIAFIIGDYIDGMEDVKERKIYWKSLPLFIKFFVLTLTRQIQREEKSPDYPDKWFEKNLYTRFPQSVYKNLPHATQLKEL